MTSKILITGVTGGLGRSVLHTLLEHVPASSLAASSSNRSTATILKDKGVEFRWVDYNVPESLQEAFKGVDKLFFVSTSEVNPEKRTKQHANVVEAAKAAGIKHVYYSSLAFGGRGSDSKVVVQLAHIATEDMLQKSGLTYTSVREGVYADAFPVFMSWYPDSQELFLPADGPMAGASRAELGEATAKLMLKEGFENQIVLLTGPKTYTFADIVDTIKKITGKELILHRVSAEEYVTKNAAIDEGKKPARFFEAWRSLLEGVAEGEVANVDPLMGELLGRPPKDGLRVIEGLLTENPRYTWHQNYMSF